MEAVGTLSTAVEIGAFCWALSVRVIGSVTKVTWDTGGCEESDSGVNTGVAMNIGLETVVTAFDTLIVVGAGTNTNIVRPITVNSLPTITYVTVDVVM